MRPELDQQMLRDSRRARPEPDPAAMRRGIAQLLAIGERAVRRRRMPLVAGVALALVLALSLVAVAAERVIEAQSAEATTRVVDRTFVCTAGVIRGLRGIKISAHPRNEWGDASGAAMTSGQGATSTIVGLEAGPVPSGGRPTGAAHYTHLKCRQVSMRIPGTTRPRVPLARTGLQGGPLTFGEGHNCEVWPRILVRIRAVFQRPTGWSLRPSQNPQAFPPVMRAPGTMREAYLAVRTEAGSRPLAFVALTQTQARLFVAPRCWRS